jgi:hypothetical protein
MNDVVFFLAISTTMMLLVSLMNDVVFFLAISTTMMLLLMKNEMDSTTT